MGIFDFLKNKQKNRKAVEAEVVMDSSDYSKVQHAESAIDEEELYRDYNSDYIIVSYDVQDERIMAIGNRMNEINPNAYMNGYNWDIFFEFYIQNTEPELLEDMETDSEAGMYTVVFHKTKVKTARHFQAIVTELFNSPDKIYKIIEEEGDAIPWE